MRDDEWTALPLASWVSVFVEDMKEMMKTRDQADKPGAFEIRSRYDVYSIRVVSTGGSCDFVSAPVPQGLDVLDVAAALRTALVQARLWCPPSIKSKEELWVHETMYEGFHRPREHEPNIVDWARDGARIRSVVRSGDESRFLLERMDGARRTILVPPSLDKAVACRLLMEEISRFEKR
jgi:hypothetical protein